MGDRNLAAAEAASESASPGLSDASGCASSCTQRVAPVHSAPTTGAYSAAPRARLLLVDDDPELRRWLARQLRSQGYYVESAASGEEAVAYIDQNRYDVVISDIRMPHMDGIALLREVRRHDSHVPVVLLTGAPAVTTAMQALEHGAFRYLTKSADVSELVQVLDSATHSVRRARLLDPTVGAVNAASRAASELAFEQCLRTLWVAYHPIVDAVKRELHGHEALMRSREPSLPHPGAVFDAAQQLNQLDELGRAIRACASTPYIRGDVPGLLFVNLHVTDLADPTLFAPDAPLSAIAPRVVLEITERSSLDEVKDASKRVAQLREMGFRVAVDDMGSGYAGLSSFAVLEPEYIKLDMSLVRDVHLSPTNQKIIRSMTALCRDLGIQVVAEGVETADERDTLLHVGCELLQGFLFAKPAMPFPQVQW